MASERAASASRVPPPPTLHPRRGKREALLYHPSPPTSLRGRGWTRCVRQATSTPGQPCASRVSAKRRACARLDRCSLELGGVMKPWMPSSSRPRGRGRAWGCLRLIPRGCRTVFIVSVLLVGLLLYTLMHTPMRLTPVLVGGVPPRPARAVATHGRAQPSVQLRDGEGTGGATSPVRQHSKQQISCPTYVGPGFDFKCVPHASCTAPATVVGGLPCVKGHRRSRRC
jgi:hypothetical protein